MEEYYNPTLKEFINAVLDGEILYYKIGAYPYNQPIENPEYGIIDIKVPHTISCKKQSELNYILERNNVSIETFIRFNSLLKFMEVQNTFAVLKPAVEDKLKLKDKDITEDDVDYFYFPELTVIYLKNN